VRDPQKFFVTSKFLLNCFSSVFRAKRKKKDTCALLSSREWTRKLQWYGVQSLLCLLPTNYSCARVRYQVSEAYLAFRAGTRCQVAKQKAVLIKAFVRRIA